MYLYGIDLQSLFLGCIILLMLLSLGMFKVAANMKYTRWGTERKLSIFDLQFPSSVRYYSYILTSIVYEHEVCKKKGEGLKNSTYNLLKYNLILDFIFMFPAYGMLAIMCYHVSEQLVFLHSFFLFLMYAQGLALIADAVENFFILRTLKKPKLFLKTKVEAKDKTKDKSKDVPEVMQDDEFHHNWKYQVYKLSVAVKWFIVGLALSGSLMVFTYSFSKGEYKNYSGYILTILACLLIYFILIYLFSKPKKQIKEKSVFNVPILEKCK